MEGGGVEAVLGCAQVLALLYASPPDGVLCVCLIINTSFLATLLAATSVTGSWTCGNHQVSSVYTARRIWPSPPDLPTRVECRAYRLRAHVCLWLQLSSAVLG